MVGSQCELFVWAIMNGEALGSKSAFKHGQN
jgi:hypothetical protein